MLTNENQQPSKTNSIDITKPDSEIILQLKEML